MEGWALAEALVLEEAPLRQMATAPLEAPAFLQPPVPPDVPNGGYAQASTVAIAPPTPMRTAVQPAPGPWPPATQSAHAPFTGPSQPTLHPTPSHLSATQPSPAPFSANSSAPSHVLHGDACSCGAPFSENAIICRECGAERPATLVSQMATSASERWEIVWRDGVHVRQARDRYSPSIGIKVRGSVVMGCEQDGWVALSCEPGFMATQDGGCLLLQKVPQSTAEPVTGLTPITAAAPTSEVPLPTVGDWASSPTPPDTLGAAGVSDGRARFNMWSMP